MEQKQFVGNVTPVDYKYELHEGEPVNEFYPDGQILCENSQFGEYAVPDLGILKLAKKEAEKLFKNHTGWGAKKVAKKVAEKLKLKLFNGVIREDFFKEKSYDEGVLDEFHKKFEKHFKGNEFNIE